LSFVHANCFILLILNFFVLDWLTFFIAKKSYEKARFFVPFVTMTKGKIMIKVLIINKIKSLA